MDSYHVIVTYFFTLFFPGLIINHNDNITDTISSQCQKVIYLYIFFSLSILMKSITVGKMLVATIFNENKPTVQSIDVIGFGVIINLLMSIC